MEELRDRDLMNIYEIYDRLLDLACATNDKEEELVLRNASRMLREIEIYANNISENDNMFWSKGVIKDIIYPLG